MYRRECRFGDLRRTKEATILRRVLEGRRTAVLHFIGVERKNLKSE